MNSLENNLVRKSLALALSRHLAFLRLAAGLACVLSSVGFAGDFKISSLNKAGVLTVTNAFTNGIVTIETAPTVSGPWSPVKNFFSLGSGTDVKTSVDSSAGFFRALAVDLS